jgi:hypothetical protein
MRASGLAAFAFAFAILLAARPALAQETIGTGNIPDQMGGPQSDALVDPGLKRSWQEGQPRLFAATQIDAGFLYLRPRGQIGYGKPFNAWVGLEANPVVANQGWGAYGGVRLAWRFADLRVGVRHFRAWTRTFLEPKGSYDRLDLDTTGGPIASMTTLETELNLGFPVGPGDIIGTFSASDVEGIPEGYYVFEETLRVIVDPPFVWRARGGYVFRWGEHDQYSIGPVVDVLNVPAREDDTVVRAGPVMRITLSRHFDVRGSFVTTLISRDRLGLVGGDFTELGVRYRLATE